MLRRLVHSTCKVSRRLYSEVIVSGESAVKAAASIENPGGHHYIKDRSFRLLAASILTRQPILLRPLSPFEAAYETYRIELEEERSRGPLEIMTAHKKELAQIHGGQKGDAEVALPPLPEAYQKADGDVTSLMRKLDRKLYFVVRDENGVWTFPSVITEYVSTPLHKLASRCVARLTGDECEIYNVGRAPVAYYKAMFEGRAAAPFGSKAFFFRSQLVGGNVIFRPQLTANQCAWLTKEELSKALPEPYYASIQPVLSY